MARKPGQDRLYTEKETARILRRAADIQSREAMAGDRRDGVSAEELIRIGQEVGLEEGSLLEAIRGLDEDGDEVQTRWLGAPPSYELERVLEGSFGENQWQAVVGQLNATFHQSIAGVTSGPVRTWHWKHELGSIHFTATETPTSVRLKMVSFIDDGIALAMILSTIGMFGAVMAMWAIDSFRPFLSLLFTFLTVIGVGLWFRSATSKWYRRDRIKLNRVMGHVEEAIRLQRATPNPSSAALSGEEPLSDRIST
jgi:hypothetical protein